MLSPSSGYSLSPGYIWLSRKIDWCIILRGGGAVTQKKIMKINSIFNTHMLY